MSKTSPTDFEAMKARLISNGGSVETNYEKAHHPLASRPQTPQPEQAIRHEPLAASRLQGRRAERIFVRFVQFTRQRQDPDNCCCKFALDWLRNQGAIPDDTDDDIALEVSQVQVAVEEEEGVLIEVL